MTIHTQTSDDDVYHRRYIYSLEPASSSPWTFVHSLGVMRVDLYHGVTREYMYTRVSMHAFYMRTRACSLQLQTCKLALHRFIVNLCKFT